ncbi:MAG: hypothetical protein IJU00_14885 [Selenomonas sp.]|nr:hypothetical protein [Selenomonas sp.]
MAKRRRGDERQRRAIYLRWRRFLRRFEQERKRRQKDVEAIEKAVESAGLIGIALISIG